jgi:hypothetical protein
MPGTPRHAVWVCALAAAFGLGSGCAGPPRTGATAARVGNPLFVAGNNDEAVWERIVDVIHDYRFEIARENKLDGIIETRYKVGSGVLEPWHADSVGAENRWESSLQSIRRRVFVTITPVEGGFLVGTEAFKELEDVQGPVANSVGGATFLIDQPLQRDLNLVTGQSRPSGWIPVGRDVALERALVADLQYVLTQ